MSNMQPGTWYVYKDEHENAISVIESGFGPKGGWVGVDIAHLPVPGKRKTQEDINGHARLISSAPDLLEALNTFAKHFGPLEDNEMLHPDARRCFELARAAIAKATGGEA